MISSTREKYHVLGIMSGTSLDGVDLALCEFKIEGNNWMFEINKAQTIDYSKDWKKKLESAHLLKKVQLDDLHLEYGRFTGSLANSFLKGLPKPDYIASHGHTIFHEPVKGITFQLGKGNEIASVSGLPVIWDFRSGDVALGGQGAPLVPVGDELLLGEYEFCLNLGGFSNISYSFKGCRTAFDICPVNIVLNQLAGILGYNFDKDGALAYRGNIDYDLLTSLNNLDYYKASNPKSLGREWVESYVNPLLTGAPLSVEDKLRTFSEHVAHQLARATNEFPPGRILTTGGGALNRFLIQLFREKTHHEIVIPDLNLVNFKEAMVFAFLGLLRTMNINNCYASVTGAKSDSCAGIISFP